MRKLTTALMATLATILLGCASAAGVNSKTQLANNLDIFNAIAKELASFYVDSIDAERTVTAAINAMLAELDPYTEYIPLKDQEKFEAVATAEYGGIGATVIEREGCNVMISEPQAGSPAARAGLRAGDLIVAVDGDSVLGLGSVKVVERLKGKPGTQLTVRVKRPYATPDSILDITLEREKIFMPSVPYYGVTRDNLGYISLTTFSEKTPDEVHKAVTDLTADPAVKALVLDLRGNGGGIMESAVKVVGLFVPKGTEVLRTKGKGVLNEKIYRTTQSPVNTEIPLYVLIDGNSASASEIVTGALQDLDRAVVVGNRSYGKGLVQTSRPLPFDGLLKLTMAKYYIPSGRLIQAIDYSHRNTDGAARRIPDSLTNVFTTANGRVVRDGGGITPDSTITYPEINRLVYNIVRDNWAFDYATKFAAEHPTIPPAAEFEITDEIYDDFKKSIDPKRLQYDRVCEIMVKSLEEVARNEGYMNDSVAAQIDVLKGMLRHNLDNDLEFHRKDISSYLANYILVRYYYTPGEIINQLKTDPAIEAVVAIAGQPGAYDRLLAPGTIVADKSTPESDNSNDSDGEEALQ